MSRKKTNSEIMNDFTYTHNFNYLKNIATNRFVWSNLPVGLESRHIEKFLFEYGQALFFKDDILGLVCLPCTPSGGFNIYGDNIEYRAYGFGGFSFEKNMTLDNSVLIRNNALCSPTRLTTELYANRISEIDRTVEINVCNQKTPYLLSTDDKSLFSIKNLFKKIISNEPVIFADKSLGLNHLTVFPTVAPFVSDKLTDLKNTIRNEYLTFLGINNTNTDKKERLVTDEVNSNNDLIYSSIDYMYEMRKQAVEQINEMYDLNITVEIKEGEEDAELYSDDKANSTSEY